MALILFTALILVWCIGDSICKRLDAQNFILKDIADSLEALTDNNSK